MRHDDIRRSRDVDGVWLRLRLWLSAAPKRQTPESASFDNLSDHQRRDIGLPDERRYLDWKSLRSADRFVDFTR